MLTEKRQEEILEMLHQKGSVTLQELKDHFKISESTIRRDLNALDAKGALTKVFGGAVRSEDPMDIKEEQVSNRETLNADAKAAIGQYAASLIGPDDFVYLDAGTTTGFMIPYLTQRSAVFVTNAVSHALSLGRSGFRVILIGGEFKSITEALVGNEAYVSLEKYNFTKGFFGANGVSPSAGYTTPDINEALVKKCAMDHTQNPYILCDSSKFYHRSPVTFGDFSRAKIITEMIPDKTLAGYSHVIAVQ
ncbi:DeoR family fructose operon transcriptional repressor [Catenibacillus scindens]|uniref:DeoR family fructose operon transcriptional repressor n=1 Tax=Catenibacillus scindens TaxID=673271 RepID=A0A7W8H953_9FIRM|nr:DeoR/GlpR family DNA-binding transcription regulator [Catenibacillus scindens]MBB5264092.1 DeoR family fructose operon transcriptional repressor [Catenibacillus scindens]